MVAKSIAKIYTNIHKPTDYRPYNKINQGTEKDETIIADKR